MGNKQQADPKPAMDRSKPIQTETMDRLENWAEAPPRIKYRTLFDLEHMRHPANPKDHDIGALIVSIERFGFTLPILLSDPGGHIVAGHGRVQALGAMKRNGYPVPAGIRLAASGEWQAPTITQAFKSDADEKAYLIADNRLVELGGWNRADLIAALADLAAIPSGLNGTGYDADDLDAMIADEHRPVTLPPADAEGSHDSDHGAGSTSDPREDLEAGGACEGDLWKFGSDRAGWRYALCGSPGTMSYHDYDGYLFDSHAPAEIDDMMGRARAEGLETIRLCAEDDWA